MRVQRSFPYHTAECSVGAATRRNLSGAASQCLLTSFVLHWAELLLLGAALCTGCTSSDAIMCCKRQRGAELNVRGRRSTGRGVFGLLECSSELHLRSSCQALAMICRLPGSVPA